MGRLQRILSILISQIGFKSSRWEVEVIKGEYFLFRRIHWHYVLVDNGKYEISPGGFLDKRNEISCDCSKYSTSIKTFNLIGKEYKFGKLIFKEKNHFFIASLEIKPILEVTNNNVLHNPIQEIPEKIGTPNNRAHSIIKAKNDSDEERIIKDRFWLAENSKWEIFEVDRYLNNKTKQLSQRKS